MRGLALALALLLAAAGCSRGGDQGPATGGAPATPLATPHQSTRPEAPVDRPAAAADPPAAVLLPTDGTHHSYFLAPDQFAEEHYVRDGERLIGSYNGKTYVTWFITEQGIWRADPKGPALLRYLPPVLKDGTAWKQASGSEDVLFLLRERAKCDHPVGNAVEGCWELTVLNRLERTLFRFASGDGILYVWSENLQDPADAYTKVRRVPPPVADPPRDRLVQEGARRPAGPLPAVTEISAAEFHEALRAELKRAGRPFLEIDLNGDGAQERIEGKLGEWHSAPLHLFAADGRRLEHAFHNRFDQNAPQHRLDVVTIPGIDRPTLLYQHGRPGTWHAISTRWLHEDLVGAFGWHPRIFEAFGADVRIDGDGAIVVTNNPADLAGYTWTRRYRVEKQNGSQVRYGAKLLEERVSAGPYPSGHADLVTAAFVAHWFGLDGDLERYVPDPAARAALQAAKVTRPPYVPARAEVGKIVERPGRDPQVTYPEVEPAPVAPDGNAQFLLRVTQYEGAFYHSGRVTFGREADGRLVIRRLEVDKSRFVY